MLFWAIMPLHLVVFGPKKRKKEEQFPHYSIIKHKVPTKLWSRTSKIIAAQNHKEEEGLSLLSTTKDEKRRKRKD